MDAAPPAAPPRYARRPLPPYRYVPGRAPHPRRHPEGHSRGWPEPAPERCPPDRWDACESWLHAVDLFNRGFWWECHEALEALWRGAGPDTREGRFFQGVLLAAAAALRREAGSPGGAGRLGRRALARLEGLEEDTMGVDVPGWRRGLERALAAGADPPTIRLRGRSPRADERGGPTWPWSR